MLTLRQLRYLVALSREGHFGQAARACGVSQPALSMQIKELEAALGTVVAERRRGRVAMTQAGRETVRRARLILTAVDDLAAAARPPGDPVAGAVKLGVIPTIAPYLLPRALPLLRERFPAIALELREGRTDQIVRELDDGELDLLLLSLPLEQRGIESLHLFDDRFLLVRPSGAPVPTAGRVAHADIDHDRMLLLEEGHCLRDQALSFCRMGDRNTLRSLGATSLATLVQMVAAGYGVTLVPEMAMPVEVRDARLTADRFADPEPRRAIGLTWRRGSPRRGDFMAIGEALKTLAPPQ